MKKTFRVGMLAFACTFSLATLAATAPPLALEMPAQKNGYVSGAEGKTKLTENQAEEAVSAKHTANDASLKTFGQRAAYALGMANGERMRLIKEMGQEIDMDAMAEAILAIYKGEPTKMTEKQAEAIWEEWVYTPSENKEQKKARSTHKQAKRKVGGKNAVASAATNIAPFSTPVQRYGYAKGVIFGMIWKETSEAVGEIDIENYIEALQTAYEGRETKITREEMQKAFYEIRDVQSEKSEK